jgi:catechol 2,3-dioxygenase-like lactoylglutathione lyase family enzyme
MSVLKLDHVGIVVRSVAELVGLMSALGLEFLEEIERPDRRVAFFRCGTSRIELIELRDDAARDARLDGVKASIDHLGLLVPDLESAVSELSRLGIEPAEPRREGSGLSVRMCDPDTTEGIMLQLVERFC